MKVTIKTLLTQAAQKADLLAGGRGTIDHDVVVESGDPLFAGVLGRATVGPDGTATWDLRHGGIRFDEIPTAASALEAAAAADRKKAEEAAALEERSRLETLKVVRERRTRVTTRVVFDGNEGYSEYDEHRPDWPPGTIPVHEGVRASAEAASWLAEIEARNEAARAEAKVRATADRLARERVKAEEEAREAAFRASLGLGEGDRAFRVEGSALAEVPVWQSHSRGSNWMAVIQSDPTKTGGLDRAFEAKAKGDHFYIVAALRPGDAVEFGADYRSGSGRKTSHRWYGTFLRRAAAPDGQEYLVFREAASGKEAIREGAMVSADTTPA